MDISLKKAGVSCPDMVSWFGDSGRHRGIDCNNNTLSGSAETLYAFAPSYAASYRKAGAKCTIHVGKGMHHCYALQYFIPGCKPAFNEIMKLICDYFN